MNDFLMVTAGFTGFVLVVVLGIFVVMAMMPSVLVLGDYLEEVTRHLISGRQWRVERDTWLAAANEIHMLRVRQVPVDDWEQIIRGKAERE